MNTINFEQHWGYAEAAVACRECGRISKRKVRDYCTVNPYNRNEDGTIKSGAQVRADAQSHAEREAKRQEEKGRVCRPCQKGGEA